jgi:peptidoglycan/xylan/chitin deacetylase (PgdA/CDA1 family)
MIKQTLRRAIARVAPSRPPGGIRVLLYHAVDSPDPIDSLGLRVSREAFLKQMHFLRSGGYKVVSLASSYEDGIDDDSPRLAITFDDGYRSQAWAVNVLREFGFPATLFVVPRFLDGVKTPQSYWEAWDHLDWGEIAALAGEGIDVGAHSLNHVDLTTCAAEQLEAEVVGARRVLRSRLGREILAFSYPHGRYDRRVRDAVEGAGYRVACTSCYGDNRSMRSAYTLQRTEVGGTDDPVDFEWKLQGKFDWLAYWQPLRLAVAKLRT